MVYAGNPFCAEREAASHFVPGSEPLAQALQRIEVRAFACLLEELLERYTGARDGGAWRALVEVHGRCSHPVPSERPLFSEIEQTLSGLMGR